MSGPNIGFATLSIVPSARGFKAHLQKEIGGALDGASKNLSTGSGFMAGMATAGGKIVSVMGKATKAVGGLGIVTAGLALKGGFSRAMAIEDAQAALRGLGHDTKSIERIMDSALASVKGTAFGLGEATTIASTAVAAGIEPGKELTRTLTLTANAAALARTGLDEMGSILNKVWTAGRVQTDDLNQLADRGIPIWTKLAESYGVNAVELRKMVEKGEVDAGTFATVLEDTVGNAALAMGDTTRGAWQNMMAALSRAGESFLQGVWPLFKRGLEGFTDLVDRLAPKVEEFGKKISDWIRDALPTIKDFASEVKDRLAPALGTVATVIAGTLLPKLMEFGQWMLDNEHVLIGVITGIGAAILKSLVPAFLAWAVSAATAAAAQIALLAPYVAIGAAIAALTAGVIWAYQNVDWFRNSVDAVGRFMRDTLWPILQSVAAFLGEAFVAAWDAVSTAAKWLWENVLQPAFDWISGTLMPVLMDLGEIYLSAVATYFGMVSDAAKWLWDNVLQPLWDWISGTAFPIIKDLAEKHLSSVVGAFESVTGAAKWLWNSILQPLAEWIAGHFTGIVDDLAAAWQALEDPIKWLMGIGETAFDGLVDAINKLIGPLKTAADYLGRVSDLAGKIPGFSGGVGGAALFGPIGFAAGALKDVLGFSGGGQVPAHLASGGLPGMHPGGPRGSDIIPAWLSPGEFVMRSSAVRRFGLAFMEAINAGRLPSMPGGSGAVRSSGRDLGRSWGDGLRDGLDRMWTGIVGAAHRLAGAVTSTTESDWGVASPSKVAAGLGKNFGAGLVLGMSESEVEARRAAEYLATAAVDGVMKVNPEFERAVDQMTSKLWSLDKAFRDMTDDDNSSVGANDFIKALRTDTAILSKFHRDLQAISKAGYRDLAALLVQRGPETAGLVAERLADAARKGNAGLLADMRTSIAEAEDMYDRLGQYIRDEIVPWYVGEFVIVTGEKITAAAESLSGAISNAFRAQDPAAGLGESFQSFVDSAVSGISTVGDAFRDMNQDGQLSVQDMLSALSADMQAMRAWESNLAAIAGRGYADVAGMLAERGPQAAGRMVQELADLAKGGDTSLLRNVQSALTNAQETYDGVAAYVRDELAPQVVLTSGVIGEEIADAFANGLSFDDRMRLAAKAAGLALSEEGKAIALIAATEGEAAALNYALALKLEPATVEEGLKAGEALKRLPKSPFSQAGASIGEAFADGLTMGMVAARMDVVLQAAQLGVEMAKATRAALKSASPSRVAMAIGEDFGAGLAIGIAEQSSAVVAAAEYIARAAADGASLGGPVHGGQRHYTPPAPTRDFAASTAVTITLDSSTSSANELAQALDRWFSKSARVRPDGNWS